MKKIENIKPFTKFCCTIGNIPSSYLISMTYEEQLIWLCNYLEKTVIPSVNENAEAIVELQNLFIELKDYVDHYFDNLDIQTEINNKLDEMAESGQLTEIIGQYLEISSIIAYNTLNDLANADNLINGSFTRIYGKITYNDGYGAYYKIRTKTESDTPDGDNLVTLINFPTLIAEKIEDTTINSLVTKVETINPVGLYNNKNMVVFGDSWTDPDNGNSLNGYWVNKVATATGMTPYNFAKGGASFLRTSNSYRMQLTRALEMTQEQKNNTSLVIVYASDTDILETDNVGTYVTEVEYVLNSIHTNYPNAKIIFAGFTWRCNQLINEYNQRMINYLFAVQRNCNELPLVILKYASYWLLGIPGYFQNQYHPNQNGYNVVAGHFINVIYGGADEIRDTYFVELNLDNQTDDRRCVVDVYQDRVDIQFHCVYNTDLTNKYDWIAGFPKIALPQPDIVFPVCTVNGEVVGTFTITSYNERANIYIKNLTAGTAIFVNGSYRAQANFTYNS